MPQVRPLYQNTSLPYTALSHTISHYGQHCYKASLKLGQSLKHVQHKDRKARELPEAKEEGAN